MTEIKFKSRNDIKEVLEYNKDENLDLLIKKLNQLAEIGWDFHQWSTTYQDIEPEELYEKYPNYDEMTDKEQHKVFSKLLESKGKICFIESFGESKEGYLRGEGHTFLKCAEKILNQAIKIENCNHEWAYTHSNGHKTCKHCRKFASCTVEEALENYESGSVKIDKHHSLVFNHNKALCDCGSHKLIYHDLSMLDTKSYQCNECDKFIPVRYKNLSHTSYPVGPNSDDYENGTEEPLHDSGLKHRLLTIGVSSRPHIEQQIHRYITRMYLHFLHIERKVHIKEFIEWVNPYLEEYITSSNAQIKEEEKHYNVKGLTNLHINSSIKEKKFDISYDLLLEETADKQKEPVEIFTELFKAFASEDKEE